MNSAFLEELDGDISRLCNTVITSISNESFSVSEHVRALALMVTEYSAFRRSILSPRPLSLEKLFELINALGKIESSDQRKSVLRNMTALDLVDALRLIDFSEKNILKLCRGVIVVTGSPDAAVATRACQLLRSLVFKNGMEKVSASLVSWIQENVPKVLKSDPTLSSLVFLGVAFELKLFQVRDKTAVDKHVSFLCRSGCGLVNPVKRTEARKTLEMYVLHQIDMKDKDPKEREKEIKSMIELSIACLSDPSSKEDILVSACGTLVIVLEGRKVDSVCRGRIHNSTRINDIPIKERIMLYASLLKWEAREGSRMDSLNAYAGVMMNALKQGVQGTQLREVTDKEHIFRAFSKVLRSSPKTMYLQMNDALRTNFESIVVSCLRLYDPQGNPDASKQMFGAPRTAYTATPPYVSLGIIAVDILVGSTIPPGKLQPSTREVLTGLVKLIRNAPLHEDLVDAIECMTRDYPEVATDVKHSLSGSVDLALQGIRDNINRTRGRGGGGSKSGRDEDAEPRIPSHLFEEASVMVALNHIRRHQPNTQPLIVAQNLYRNVLPLLRVGHTTPSIRIKVAEVILGRIAEFSSDPSERQIAERQEAAIHARKCVDDVLRYTVYEPDAFVRCANVAELAKHTTALASYLCHPETDSAILFALLQDRETVKMCALSIFRQLSTFISASTLNEERSSALMSSSQNMAKSASFCSIAFIGEGKSGSGQQARTVNSTTTSSFTDKPLTTVQAITEAIDRFVLSALTTLEHSREPLTVCWSVYELLRVTDELPFGTIAVFQRILRVIRARLAEEDACTNDTTCIIALLQLCSEVTCAYRHASEQVEKIQLIRLLNEDTPGIVSVSSETVNGNTATPLWSFSSTTKSAPLPPTLILASSGGSVVPTTTNRKGERNYGGPSKDFVSAALMPLYESLLSVNRGTAKTNSTNQSGAKLDTATRGELTQILRRVQQLLQTSYPQRVREGAIRVIYQIFSLMRATVSSATLTTVEDCYRTMQYTNQGDIRELTVSILGAIGAMDPHVWVPVNGSAPQDSLDTVGVGCDGPLIVRRVKPIAEVVLGRVGTLITRSQSDDVVKDAMIAALLMVKEDAKTRAIIPVQTASSRQQPVSAAAIAAASMTASATEVLGRVINLTRNNRAGAEDLLLVDVLNFVSKFIKPQRQAVMAHISDLMSLLQVNWTPAVGNVFKEVLEVVEELAPGAELPMSRVEAEWPWLMPQLADVLDRDIIATDEFKAADTVVCIIGNCKVLTPGISTLLVNCLLRAFRRHSESNDVGWAALSQAIKIVTREYLRSFVAPVLQALAVVNQKLQIRGKAVRPKPVPTPEAVAVSTGSARFLGKLLHNEVAEKAAAPPSVSIADEEMYPSPPSESGSLTAVIQLLQEVQAFATRFSDNFVQDACDAVRNTAESVFGSLPSTSRDATETPSNSSNGNDPESKRQEWIADHKKDADAGLSKITDKITEFVKRYSTPPVDNTSIAADGTFCSAVNGTMSGTISGAGVIPSGKLSQWMSEFQLLLIEASPLILIRNTKRLFETHKAFKQAVFAPSLEAVYKATSSTELPALLDQVGKICLEQGGSDVTTLWFTFIDFIDSRNRSFNARKSAVALPLSEILGFDVVTVNQPTAGSGGLVRLGSKPTPGVTSLSRGQLKKTTAVDFEAFDDSGDFSSVRVTSQPQHVDPTPVAAPPAQEAENMTIDGLLLDEYARLKEAVASYESKRMSQPATRGTDTLTPPILSVARYGLDVLMSAALRCNRSALGIRFMEQQLAGTAIFSNSNPAVKLLLPMVPAENSPLKALYIAPPEPGMGENPEDRKRMLLGVQELVEFYTMQGQSASVKGLAEHVVKVIGCANTIQQLQNADAPSDTNNDSITGMRIRQELGAPDTENDPAIQVHRAIQDFRNPTPSSEATTPRSSHHQFPSDVDVRSIESHSECASASQSTNNLSGLDAAGPAQPQALVNPQALESLLRSRINHARWKEVLSEVEGKNLSTSLASHAATAALALGEWDKLKDFLPLMSPNDRPSPTQCLYRGVLEAVQGNMDEVPHHTKRVRQLVEEQLRAAPDSRYGTMVDSVEMLQLTRELEEATMVSKWMKLLESASKLQTPSESTAAAPPTSLTRTSSTAATPESVLRQFQTRFAHDHNEIVSIWQQRFSNMRTSSTMSMVIGLCIRSLVLSPKQCAGSWLRLARFSNSSMAAWAAEKVVPFITAWWSSTGGSAPTVDQALGTYKRTHQTSTSNDHITYNLEKLFGGASSSLTALSTKFPEELSVAVLDHFWSTGRKDIAIRECKQLLLCAGGPAGDPAAITSTAMRISTNSVSSVADDSKSMAHRTSNFRMTSALRAKLNLKVAQWLQDVNPNYATQDPRNEVLGHLLQVTEFDSANYRGWHEWGLMNYRIVQFDLKLKSPESPQDVETADCYAERAQQGFFAAISYAPSTSMTMQDILRLIQLWRRRPNLIRVTDNRQRVMDGIRRVPLASWAAVVPQLVGHLNAEDAQFTLVIEHIVSRLCTDMPQSTVFALWRMVLKDRLDDIDEVTSQPRTSSMIKAEQSATHLISLCDGKVADDCRMVSHCLASAAVLPIECIQQVTNRFVTFCNSARRQGPKALVDFLTHRGLVLAKMAASIAYEYGVLIRGQESTPLAGRLDRLVQHCSRGDLNEAVGLGERVHMDVSREVQDTAQFKLSNIPLAPVNPPRLASRTLSSNISTAAAPSSLRPASTMKNLAVCVPGSFVFTAPTQFPTVASLEEHVSIMSTAHRPRKLAVMGSDGERYIFVLKGQEDLRQDERVMQLFSFVNMQLAAAGKRGRSNGGGVFVLEEGILGADDAHSSGRSAPVESSQALSSCSLQTYCSVPLTKNIGLLGWVEDSHTFSECIVQHREENGVEMSIEKTIVTEICGDPTMNPLCVIEKADVLGTLRDCCRSDDIARTLWLDSSSSDAWLRRRQEFTESCAVASMVGYVIGLGDRHLGNLMLNTTGRIVHIDFGDCFDVSRMRSRHPECVPFRLTPMIVRGMEVFGVRGTFRHTAQRTMQLLRENRDAITALLSAFLYDPTVALKVEGANLTGEAALMPTVERLRSKLHGKDRPASSKPFAMRDPLPGKLAGLPVEVQVDRLIEEATSLHSLGGMYHGWCPWL